MPATGTAMGMSLITNLSTRSVKTVSPTTSNLLNSKEKSDAKPGLELEDGPDLVGPFGRVAVGLAPGAVRGEEARELVRITLDPRPEEGTHGGLVVRWHVVSPFARRRRGAGSVGREPATTGTGGQLSATPAAAITSAPRHRALAEASGRAADHRHHRRRGARTPPAVDDHHLRAEGPLDGVRVGARRLSVHVGAGGGQRTDPSHRPRANG